MVMPRSLAYQISSIARVSRMKLSSRSLYGLRRMSFMTIRLFTKHLRNQRIRKNPLITKWVECALLASREIHRRWRQRLILCV